MNSRTLHPRKNQFKSAASRCNHSFCISGDALQCVLDSTYAGLFLQISTPLNRFVSPLFPESQQIGQRTLLSTVHSSWGAPSKILLNAGPFLHFHDKMTLIGSHPLVRNCPESSCQSSDRLSYTTSSSNRAAASFPNNKPTAPP
ncbi:hypothetical protein PDIG_54490 [Penicillium digitatum PHI26]|uniref:Uncharacterized protein n=2 Tax=Penicillium digitatum TaxID=36651 RepID=K9GCI1_PEND2|nr:hypothetical protein PDIP_49710 [Penicillium digitatum Pd1]EKV10961.1 hypothetical protein PDIG_54490 [Penicillium digitatum PHI26]EKV13283.1 hypothetical protein PDIP_49710 [Penicillium digitatum Pd1]